MTWKKKFKARTKGFKKARKEAREFKADVAKSTLKVRRESYQKEALKVAEERGKELARRPPVKKVILQALAKGITPSKKAITRKVVYRKAPKKGKGKRKRITPKATRRAIPIQQPFNIRDLI